MYNRAFKLLSKYKEQPRVVYPAIQESIFNQSTNLKIEEILKQKPRHVLMSLNRYEWKKNVPLAVKAFSEFLRVTKQNKSDFHLVIAGGYDDAVIENKEVYDEL